MSSRLRDAIADEVQAYARYMANGADSPLAVADRILALPEIAEALKFKTMLNDINKVGREHADIVRNLGHSIAVHHKD